MPTLLIVHHTPSPATHTLLEAAQSGATDPQISGIDVVVRPALTAVAVDVLSADTAGAVKAVEVITTGLRWRAVQQAVSVIGEPRREDLDACWELGAAVSALISAGLA